VGGRETILLVEDDEALRELVAEALGDAGYEVISAGGGVEALAKVHAHKGAVHLTLVDVVMPGMNGRELAQRLHYFRPGLRVLYMSGYTDDIISARGLLEPGTLLLHKPFDNAGLLQHVRSALSAGRLGTRTETSLALVATRPA
jgi:DNA-binding response OmpR family regulator